MKILYKTIPNSGKAIEKRRELEAKTGLKLTCYPTGNGWLFRPYLHKEIIESQEYSDLVMNFVTEHSVNGTGLSFTYISEHMKLGIIDILQACQYLINHKLIRGDVSRDGKIIGVHKINF